MVLGMDAARAHLDRDTSYSGAPPKGLTRNRALYRSGLADDQHMGQGAACTRAKVGSSRRPRPRVRRVRV